MTTSRSYPPDFTPRPWIYVAGPYTRPDPIENTRTAILAGDELYWLGFFPVVPHLTMLQHLLVPKPVEHWYAYDLQALARCDALIRLPGDSTGADAEVRFARSAGIPVFDPDFSRLRSYFRSHGYPYIQ